MDSRVAVIAILVRDSDSVEALNGLLHEFGGYVVGRMGVPYAKRGVNIISVAVDAPQAVTSALTGKIGRLKGVSVKTVYAPAEEPGNIE
ncbi:TM1266 family iron-only hydrogenase system putative regulator [Oscillibacter sp.]|uniref:TM1266 family iron-only hydrogenase system putative regulator n=1 Tax=Oscillibacter sp. TaxID=1945593 RepID=UPI00289C919B|nr:TM1266 family iron-only hydrogenase system putative regulator [Oscillibacter sp.]